MASGDRELAALFRELHPQLCRFLACLLGDRSAAQDIAQESFLRLHRFGADRLPAREARFWLFRVARNLAVNEHQRKRTRRRLFDQLAALFRGKAPTPEAELESAESSSQVLALVRGLPEHQRAALLLREQEDMSYRDIARVLDVSESKVKVDIFRARTALRARWGEIDEAERARRRNNG